MLLDIIFWLGVCTVWGALMWIALVEKQKLDKPKKNPYNYC